MSPIESNLQHIRAQMNAAITVLPSAMQKPVVLVAVSKSKSPSEVSDAFVAGQREFGENYVQEAVAKIEVFNDFQARGIVWHFIGPLQSNKLKTIAKHFNWVQGIDRLKIAVALSRHRSEVRPDRGELNVCIQVNVSEETSKSGIAPGNVPVLAAQVARLPHLRLRGLMTIIEHTHDEATQRAQFRKMRTLFDTMRSEGMDVDTLSMGMSQDFPLAISEGATMVRIGSAIFGSRG